MLRRSITGQLEPRGAFIDSTIMATHFQVSTMKTMGLVCPAPVTVRTLIDTGASGSVLDPSVISQLNLTLVGSVLVHTPSTGSNYATFNQGSSGVPGGWYWVVRRKLLFSNDLWRKAGHSVYRTQVTEIK